MKKAILILFLLFLSFSSLCYAQEDFSIDILPESINLCSCSDSTISFNVYNTGDTISDYSIAFDNIDFVSASDVYFRLNPAESKLITLFIYAPCNDDIYNLDLMISTDSLSVNHEMSLNVKECENINVNPVNTYVDTNNCEEAEYSFLVENLGNVVENVEFSVNELYDYATLNMNDIELQAGETKNVKLFINTPCDLIGEYDLDFLVYGRENIEIPLELNIEPKNYPIIAEGIDVIKTVSNSVVDIPIKNVGNYNGSFEFYVEGLNWVSVEERKEINGESTENVKLTINPDSVEKGNYEFILVSRVDGKEYAKQFVVEYRDSFGIGYYLQRYLVLFIVLLLVLIGGIAYFIYWVITSSGLDFSISKVESKKPKISKTTSKSDLVKQKAIEQELRRKKKEELRLKIKKEQERKKAEREKLKLQKKKEYERKKAEKLKERERKKQERIKKKELKRLEREKKKIQRLNKKLEKKNQLQKKKEAKLKEKEKKKAEKLRKIEEKRKTREKEKEKRILEAEKKRRKRELIKIELKKEKAKRLAKEIIQTELKKDYHLISKVSKKSEYKTDYISPKKSLLPFFIIIIIILILAGLAIIMVSYWLYVLIGLGVLLVVIFIREIYLSRYKILKYLSNRDKKKIQDNVFDDYSQVYELVPKIKIIRKKSFWKYIIFILILMMIIGSIILSLYHNYFIYISLGLAILLIIWALCKIIYRFKCKYKRINNVEEKIPYSIKGFGKGINEIIIKFKNEKNKINIKIRKLRSPRTFIPVPGDIIGCYKVIKDFKSRDTEKIAIKLKIPKTWENKYENVRLYQYNGERWVSLKLDKICSDKKYIFYNVEVRKLGLFVISGNGKLEKRITEKKIAKKVVKRKPMSKKTKKRIRVFLWILLIIMAIFLVIPTSFDLNYNIGINSDLKFDKPLWNDATYILDAEYYFSDPDGDKLIYSVDDLKGLNAKIDKGNIYLSVKEGYNGDVRINIIANDNNSETESGLIEGKTAKNPYSYMKNLEYLFYIKLAILPLVVIIVLFLIFWKK